MGDLSCQLTSVVRSLESKRVRRAAFADFPGQQSLCLGFFVSRLTALSDKAVACRTERCLPFALVS